MSDSAATNNVVAVNGGFGVVVAGVLVVNGLGLVGGW